MKKVLGIDQSFTGCAYVLLIDGGVAEFGVIKSDKTTDMFARSLATAIKLCELYEQFTPDLVKFEGLAFGMTGNVTRDLAGLLFTIINVMTIKCSNFNYTLTPPTSVKKFATGSGKAKKIDMINALPEHVKKQFMDKNFKKTTGLADLSDAYWIGMHLL